MNSSTRRRSLLTGSAAVCVAAVLTFTCAGAAHAHVTASSDTAEAGSYAVVTLSVPHGCSGLATTAVSIKIPEGINAVTPTRNAFYTVEKVEERRDSPTTDSHGNSVTERVSEVVYTATTPLPADQRDTFELSLQLPHEAAGTTLHFPTVQTCEEGAESAWVEIPAEGQNSDDLALPAPALAVLAAGDATSVTAPAVGDAPNSGEQALLIVASLIVGATGLVTGALALFRGRKKA